jgi:Bacterial PH domain
MGSTEQLRSSSARALAVAMVVGSAVAVASVTLTGIETLLTYGGPCALFGVLGWAAFWRPRVEVSDGGVVVVNTLRTITVPWPAIEGVDGRYGLRLRTAYGSVTAWAAAAPAGRQRARGQDSAAARVVTERLESLRAAGHLDDARLERSELGTTWHRDVVVAVTVLAAASVALPLLV